MAPAPEPPRRETGPQVDKAEAFRQLGGFRGVFNLLKETGSEQDKEKFADMMADFLDGPKLTAVVRALRL